MNMINIDYAMERTEKPSTPELKMWSAVVALAIRDMCAKPNKGETVPNDTRTAFQFLMTEESDIVLDLIDQDPDALRDRLKLKMTRGDTIEWRNARINYNKFLKLTGART